MIFSNEQLMNMSLKQMEEFKGKTVKLVLKNTHCESMGVIQNLEESALPSSDGTYLPVGIIIQKQYAINCIERIEIVDNE